MALNTLKSLEAEIKLLEAQKKLVEKRDHEVPGALAILQRYATVLTLAQRRQVAKIIGEVGEISSASTSKANRKSSKGRSLGKVAPKYRLPTGETWSGRGLTPKVFVAWAKSAEGKAWTSANKDERFPPAGALKAAAGAGAGAKKASKKVARKSPAKKAAVKKAPAKKAVQRAPRKSAKKSKAG